MVGSGSPTRPYLIGQEGGGNPLQNLDVVDDPTLDLTITGDGTVIDKRLISGKATQSMTNLKDVRPGQALVVGDIPIWRTDHWEFEPAGTSLPPGGTDGQVLTKQSSTSGDANWETPTGGGGGGAVLEPPIRAAYWRSAAMAPFVAGAAVIWDTTERTAEGIAYDSATGIFTVAKTGWYLVTTRVRLTSTVTSLATQYRLVVNGTIVDFVADNISTVASSVVLSRQVYLSAADAFYLQLSSSGAGVSLSVSGSKANSVEVSRLDQSVAPGGGGVVVERPVIISRQQAVAIPAVASGATATMTWDTLEYSEGAWGFTAGVFTIPVAGYYQVNCKAAFAANATGKRELRVLVNGVSTGPGNVISATVTGSSGTVVSYSRVLRLAAGDTLRVDLSHTAGVALDVGSSGVTYNSIDITKVPQAFAGSAVSTYGERIYAAARRCTTSQSVLHNTGVNISFDTADVDDGIPYNPATNQFTIPVAGYYQVNAKATFTTNATGRREMRVLVNGSSGVPGIFPASSAPDSYSGVGYSRLLLLAAGDLVTVSALQTSGVALTLNPYTSIDIHKVPAPVINGAAASGVWGVGPLAGYGADDLVGREIYIDSKGQLRAKPEALAPRTIRRKSVTQTLTAASTYYVMPFDVDDEPGGSTIPHSNGVFTVPIAGVYEVNVTALFSGASTAGTRMRTFMAGQSVRESIGLADNTSLSHSATFRLAAGDTIYTEGFASATGVTITGSSVKYTICDITRISA